MEFFISCSAKHIRDDCVNFLKFWIFKTFQSTLDTFFLSAPVVDLCVPDRVVGHPRDKSETMKTKRTNVASKKKCRKNSKCILNCAYNGQKHFPLSKKWAFIKPTNPDAHNQKRICENHFKTDDFSRDLKSELLGLVSKKKLKPSAVPSLFLNAVENCEPSQRSNSIVDNEVMILISN